jgi:hypothetical protein
MFGLENVGALNFETGRLQEKNGKFDRHMHEIINLMGFSYRDFQSFGGT